MRLLAESSSVRSSHCVAAVMAVSSDSAMTCRASEQTRSARIGLRLYGIDEEPTCDDSKGSSSSPSCCRSRRSVAILWALCASEESAWTTRSSCLRE